MRLLEARALRDLIRDEGIHCVTPLGHGPDGYFAEIITDRGKLSFRSEAEYRKYRRVRTAELAKVGLHPDGRRLSPIEMRIDKACRLSE